MIVQKPFFLIIIIVVSFATGLFFYLGFDHSITDDARQYKTIAQNLLSHGVYSLSESPPYLPTAHREPAYPIFLAGLLWLFKGSYTAVYLTQIMLFVLTVLLVYYLSSKIFGEKMARWVATVTALCPTLANFPSYLLTETLFVFFITFFMVAIFKAVKTNKTGWYICSGIVLGASSLTKAVTLLLFIPIVITGIFYCGNLDLFFKKYFRNFIIFVLSFVVIIAPWGIRNYHEFGKPNSSLLFGRALWIRGIKLDYNFKDIKKELVFSISEYAGKKLYPNVKNPDRFLLKEAIVNEERINQWIGEGYSEAEIYNIQLEEALAKIRQRPLKYLAQNFVEWVKMTSFLYIPVLNEANTIEKFGNMKNGEFLISAIRGVFKLLAYIVLFLTLFGLFGERKKWRQWIFIAVLILYINSVYSFLFGWGRYNAPFIPFYFMFAVAGINFIRYKLSHNKGD